MNFRAYMIVAATLAVFVGATSALAGIEPEADVADLTGTWAGSLKCTLYDSNGDRQKTTEDVTFEISQSGTGLRIATSYLPNSRGVSVGATMCGQARPKGNGNLAQALVAISPHKIPSGEQVDDVTVSDFLAISLSAKVDGTAGKAKGRVLPLAHDGSAGDCKIKLDRTDDSDPSIGLFDCLGIGL